jgi:GAF domain-containing protein
VLNERQNNTPSRYYIRLKTAHDTTEEFIPLTSQLMERTRADGAVIYRFESELEEFRAVAMQSAVTPRIAELGMTLSPIASAWLRNSKNPVQVAPRESIAWENLPEVLQFGFRRILVLPLRSENDLLGLLTLGRNADIPFEAQEVQGTLPIIRLVRAVLERDVLQRVVHEHKLVERARGSARRRFPALTGTPR